MGRRRSRRWWRPPRGRRWTVLNSSMGPLVLVHRYSHPGSSRWTGQLFLFCIYNAKNIHIYIKASVCVQDTETLIEET